MPTPTNSEFDFNPDDGVIEQIPLPSLPNTESVMGGFNEISGGFGSISGGFGKEPIVEKVQVKAQDLQTKTLDKQAKLGIQPLVSDEQLTTPLGKTANLLVALGIEGASILSSAVRTTGARISRQVNKSGISEKEIELYDSAQAKNQQRVELDAVLDKLKTRPESPQRDQAITRIINHLQGTRLTEEEDHLFREESIEAGDIYGRKTKSDRIHRIKEANQFIEDSDNAVKEVAKLTNTRLTEKADEKLKEKLAKGVNEYTEGDTLSSIGSILEGFADLAIDDTYAATQVFATSVPYMIGLVTAGAVTLPVDMIDRYDKSVEAFTTEFGEAPTGTEDGTMKLMAVVASLTDRLGAVASANAGKVVKKIAKSTDKLGVRVPTAVKTALGTTAATTGAIAVEGATEGVQNVLEQSAATLRDPTIDPVEALTNVAHGSFGGGAFASPGVAKAAVDIAKDPAKKVAKKVKEQVTKGIGEQTDPKEKIDKIIQEGIGGLDAKTRKEKIIELIELNVQVKSELAEEEKGDTETDKVITSLTEEHKQLTEKEKSGKSVREHVTTLKDEGTPEQVAESDTSIKVLVETMKKDTSIPLGSAEKVFGSVAFKRASKEDQKAITEYVDFLKTIDSVSSDIKSGKEDFKGLDVHLEELNAATLISDRALARKTIQSLDNFKNSHSLKLQGLLKAQASNAGKAGKRVDIPLLNNETTYYQKGTSERLMGIIQKEVDAINSTVERAKSIYIEAFKKPVVLEVVPVVEPSKVTPEVKEAPVQAEIKPEVSPFQQRVNKFQTELNVLGNQDNQLPENQEVIRTELVGKFAKAKTDKQLLSLRKELIAFKTETRTPKGVVDIEGDEKTDPRILGDKGVARKNLTSNLIEEGQSFDAGLQIPKLGKTTKVKKVLGNKSGTKASTLFKAKAKTPEGFFNTFHNFFTRYKGNNNALTSKMKIKAGKLNEDETKILDSLAQYNDSFTETLSTTSSALNNPILAEYVNKQGVQVLSTLDQDPLGYFVKETKAGKKYFNENLIGIMSTVSYNWLGGRGLSTLFNTNSDINSILGRDSDTPITRAENELLRNIGTTRTSLSEALGSEVVKQLGLEVQEGISEKNLKKLAISIGLNMMGVMSKQGLIVDGSVSAQDMANMRSDTESDTTFNSKTSTAFIRIANSTESQYEASENVKLIAEAMQGSNDFLSRVFAVTAHERYVTTSPSKRVPKKLKGTEQAVPSKINKAIAHMQSVKWGIKENMHTLVSNIDPEVLESIAGVIEVDKTITHIDNVDTVTAKNEDIRRTLGNYFKSTSKLEKEGGVFQNIYFQYEPWKNMRIGIVNNMLNPQGNKLHRQLLGAKSWTVKVPVEGTPESDAIRLNFKLAVAQAFGYDIDKNNPYESIGAFYKILDSLDTQEGIDAVLALKDTNISPEAKKTAQAALIKVVGQGGENLHTLDALVALSEYSESEEFTTNLGIEVDGVTNGVAIGLMQSPIEENMDTLLESVGIYTNAESGINYPEWKSRTGNYDLYEKLAVKWVSKLNDMKAGGGAIGLKVAAIEELVGAFIEHDQVSNIGRKLSKDPVLVTNYGASINSIIKAFNEKFLDNVVTKLEEAAKTENPAKETRKLIEQVYLIAGISNIPKGIDYRKPLSIRLNDNVIAGVKNSLTQSYGNTLEEALQEQFDGLFKVRKTIDTAMNMVFVVFKFKYDASIKEAIKENGGKDLTDTAKKEIFNSLQEDQPTLKASVSADIKDSLVLLKTLKARAYDDPTSRVQVTYAKGSTNFKHNSATATIAHTEYEQPGVSTMPIATQGQDGNTQTESALTYDFLNQHDAKVVSIGDVNAATKETNQAFWDITTDYSVLDSAYETYMRVTEQAKKDPALGKEVAKYLKSIDKKNPLTHGGFTAKFTNLKEEVTAARKVIKEAENMSIGQYAHGSDSVAIQNETVSGKGIKAFIDEITLGSSIENVDFDHLTSIYDSLLTADNSLQIFEDMKNFGNKKESTKHEQHLEGVLKNVVNSVLTASDSVLYRVGDTKQPSHGASKGERVYVNASSANRLNMSEMSMQEIQVHELLHTVLSYAIDNDFHTRKELIKLFNEVQGKVTWQDFLHTDSSGNIIYKVDKDAEITAAKERYNYIFGNKKIDRVETVDEESGLITTKSSNAYLHEFVSFGLTNEKFMEKLATIGPAKKKDTSDLSLLGKLQEWYVRALNWISGKFYGTKDVTADKALQNLANQLAGIHSKRRAQALRFLTAKQDLNDKLSKAIANKIVEPFVQWRQDALNKPDSRIGKTLSAISLIPETYRSSELRKRIKQVLRNLGVTEERFLVKLIRELQGTKGSNAKWHVLLRHSKHVIDNARKRMSNEIIKNIRESFVGGLPSDDESRALTRALFKTDISVLVGSHSMQDIVDFLKSETKLSKAISSTKAELKTYGSNANYYINQSRGLGSLMAKGKGMQDQQMLNAHNIANLTTTNQTVTGDVKKAEEIIDRLASLYALQETEADQKKLAADVIQREYEVNDADNGIIMLFNLQTGFKKEAEAQLFKGNKTLIVKGHISESFNPNVDIKIATLDEEEDLAKAGYVRGKILEIDLKDPNTKDKYFYVSKNNVGNAYLKSITSLTSRTVKGSTLLDGYRTTKSGTPTQDSIDAMNKVTSDKQSAVDAQFARPDALIRSKNTLVPILNENGKITGYRYMMTEHSKLTLMERDDRFDIVMGNMWGSITDKVNSKEVNRQVIELAYEDYKEGFAEDPNAYVRIAVDSPEERYAELYHLIPEEVRRDMKEVWGKKEIYVKRELTDLIFGYRKATLSRAPFMQNINKLFGVGNVRHLEAIWQEVVSVAKTNIVIRNPAVLIGNFVSNLALSWVKGVPPVYMIKNQALALRALNSYQKDISTRDSIALKLKVDKSLSASARNQLKVKLAQASDEVTNNPVRELVDEGIFQSIIEDIDDAKNPFSYRDRFINSEKVQKFSRKVPNIVKEAGKQAIMTEDTTAFKMMMKATQYSDFIARFALHKHNMEVKKMKKQESIADVVETFVNYDIPTSKEMQYLNDAGFFMFSKFLFRIQKVLFTIMKDRPASTLSLLLMQNAFGDISDVMDSNLVTGSVMGRVNLFLGPLDSATEISGLRNAAEIVGY